jgi:hypothetical protein
MASIVIHNTRTSDDSRQIVECTMELKSLVYTDASASCGIGARVAGHTRPRTCVGSCPITTPQPPSGLIGGAGDPGTSSHLSLDQPLEPLGLEGQQREHPVARLQEVAPLDGAGRPEQSPKPAHQPASRI